MKEGEFQNCRPTHQLNNLSAAEDRGRTLPPVTLQEMVPRRVHIFGLLDF
ncbi:Hypothetical protein SMAX5B_012141 [Scophthalmus maximus]|uniref:Uncharacterized protein n=1 Tax=Scophthalmus maximus TaxID=52904 RepID=A0A2U9AZH3_SCOMX|nr:Hypothetical protein SMAX5B_012141 [Scophthalmus maximus]